MSESWLHWALVRFGTVAPPSLSLSVCLFLQRDPLSRHAPIPHLSRSALFHWHSASPLLDLSTCPPLSSASPRVLCIAFSSCSSICSVYLCIAISQCRDRAVCVMHSGRRVGCQALQAHHRASSCPTPLCSSHLPDRPGHEIHDAFAPPILALLRLLYALRGRWASGEHARGRANTSVCGGNSSRHSRGPGARSAEGAAARAHARTRTSDSARWHLWVRVFPWGTCSAEPLLRADLLDSPAYRAHRGAEQEARSYPW